MYGLFENVILHGDYELSDMLNKINTNWIQNNLTNNERLELMELARQNAKPQNSYASIGNIIDELYNKIDELEKRIKMIEQGEAQLPVEQEQEYKEFVQPTNAHNCYNIGDKVLFNGEKYICAMNSCVWNPNVYPNAWQHVNIDETNLMF